MIPVPLSHLALVALGGGIGAGGRFLAVHWTNHVVARAGLPWGTFIVNLIGSILIGALVMLTIEQGGTSRTRLFLVTGVLGGFTTFSAFSFELSEMLIDRRFAPAALYAGGSVVLCVIGTLAGAFLMKAVIR